jgi:hypothetical protein
MNEVRFSCLPIRCASPHKPAKTANPWDPRRVRYGEGGDRSTELSVGGGGGFFNAQSAHPFENPTGITNLLGVLPMPPPVSLPCNFAAFRSTTTRARIEEEPMPATRVAKTIVKVYLLPAWDEGRTRGDQTS